MRRAIQKYGILILGILVLSGCTSMLNGYGTNVLDETVWDKFENFEIDPGMNYYASGPQDLYPIVIMGLKKQYVLDNDLWRSIPPDPKLFKDLIKRMTIQEVISIIYNILSYPINYGKHTIEVHHRPLLELVEEIYD